VGPFSLDKLLCCGVKDAVRGEGGREIKKEREKKGLEGREIDQEKSGLSVPQRFLLELVLRDIQGSFLRVGRGGVLLVSCQKNLT